MKANLCRSIGFVAALSALVAGCGDSSRRAVGTTAAPVSSTSGIGTAASGSGSTTSSTAPAASPSLASGTLEALSYNVAGLPAFLSGSSPHQNTSQISPLLNRYELVLVQEDFWYHADLQQSAQHAFQSPPLAQFTTLVNDGLNRFSESPFVDHVRVKWGQCHGHLGGANDCLSSKGFSVARHTLGPGVVVDVYNLHADAGGGTGDVQARTFQFAQLATFMATYSQGNAVLVGGDTNLKQRVSADEQVLQDFMGTAGLQEASRVLGGIPDHIDRWLFRSSLDVELTPVAWRVADEFVTPNNTPLSDHPAIHLRFDWRRLR